MILTLLVALVGCDLDREIENLLGSLAQIFWELGFERSEDPLLTELTESVGRRVAEVSPRKDIPIKFRILDIGEVNAFALPNGRIYVFRGILETTETEDELAAILAHEVGHIAGRHSLKQFRLSLGIGLLADLLNLNKRGETIQSLANLAATLYALGYSRQHERDADTYAFKLALLAGYDPKGSVTLFEKFAKGEGKPSRWLTYLSTHPPSRERLERAKRVNDDLGKICPDLPAFAAHTMVAAGYAQRGLYRHAISHYEAAINAQPSYVPALLGLARAREELQEWSEAEKFYERVLEVEPQNEEAKRGLERIKKISQRKLNPESLSEKERSTVLKWLDNALSEWRQLQRQWSEKQQIAFKVTSSAAAQAKILWSQMNLAPISSNPISFNFDRLIGRERKDSTNAISEWERMRFNNLVEMHNEMIERCARAVVTFQMAVAEVESVIEKASYATDLWVRALEDWCRIAAQGYPLPLDLVNRSDESSRILFRVAIASERDAEAINDTGRRIARAVVSLSEASNLLQRSNFSGLAEMKLQLARSALQIATSDLNSSLAHVKEKRSQVDKALLSAYQTRLSALEMKMPPLEGGATSPVALKIVAYHLRVNEERVASLREKTPDIGAAALIIAFAKAQKIEPEKLLAEIDFKTDWIGKLSGSKAPSGVLVALRWLTNAWERDWELENGKGHGT